MSEIKTKTLDESKRVNLEELAHYMGYAGKEDTEKGIEAEEAGRLREASEAFIRAGQAEKQGAQEYVDVKRTPAEAKLAELATISTKYGVETPDSPELERKVETVRQELAKKYEQYGVRPREFNLVTFERDGKPVHVVMYTSHEGIDLGDPKRSQDPERSYNSVMSNDQAHSVEIDGIKYDTRAGMKLDAYEAFVEAYKKPGHELPDGLENRRKGSAIYSWTQLTGEGQLDDGQLRMATAADNDDGSVSVLINKTDPGLCFQGVWFRPAVEL